MLQEMLLLLPKDAGRAALMVCITGSMLGAILWLIGARFSRGLITLLMVAIGGVLGVCLPRWLEWVVNTSATAIVGAMLLGLIGFAMHRLCVGVALGLVLSCWAALGVWTLLNGDAGWHWPAWSSASTLPEYLISLWWSISTDVRRLLPYVCGTAMLCGILPTVLWPRVALVLLHSSAGVSMLVGMGLAAMEYGRPQWIDAVPHQTWCQLLVLMATVAFGAVVQWQLKDEPRAEQE